MKAGDVIVFIAASAAGAIVGTVAVNLARRYLARQASESWEQPAA